MTKILKLSITKPGLHTTIQDHGRWPYRAFGIPAAGPMDWESARRANLLLGNPPDNPVMEFTMIGPVIELEGEGHFVLTGGELSAQFDGKPLLINKVTPITGKLTLSIGRVLTGCRGYLAVAGSWNLSRWLGSCSTAAQNPDLVTPESYIRKGLTITVEQTRPVDLPEIATAVETDTSPEISIIPGPEYNQFGIFTIKEFLDNQFTVSSESNRMGYRLNPLLSDYSASLEIISAGVVPGTVQVTHSGQLIILMNDAQTTGGYPRIANVVSADLSRLGQKAPGASIKFKLTSLNDTPEVSVK